jgi:hypothetical protein
VRRKVAALKSAAAEQPETAAEEVGEYREVTVAAMAMNRCRGGSK